MSEENIYKKLEKARSFIIDQKPSKDGTNDYSNYDYFTPEAVESLVHKACKSVECICICDLKQDEFGYFQTLRFIDMNSPAKSLSCELRTKHGEIKATNAAQQMGGTDTYSERYIKMKFFGIKDNALDPDSKNNTGKDKPVSTTSAPAGGKCAKCGADMKLSAKGTLYCSALCWKK